MRRLFWLSILLCPLFLMADDTTVEHIIETKHEYTIEEDAFIEVENMVGTLTIEPSENSKVQLASSFHAFSPEEARSTELAGKLRLDVVESPKKLTVRAEFPVEQHSLYYYPLAGGAKKQFSKGRTRMNYRGKEITFFSEPTPAAVYLFCDISIKVPQGMRMKVRNEVGIIHVKGFDGDLNCETSVAGQNIENGKGKVIAISGSGDVSITVFSGQAACYTASGKVNCRKMYGASELIVQTGSGPALFEGCILKELNIETGSGVIEVGKSKIDSMRTSTGSGKVSLDDCEVNNELKIETGSGSVKM
ncbi:MAG TPA: DUF4097 family beta strand repeat-containing protein, partial [Chlamydiales bacterium]|nr:DUF4097 family beta strand repeat-containing protein [Chlamydiales bacterium]